MRLALLFALTIACGDDAAADREVPLTLGSGEAEFEPFTSGGHLRLYAGTQGGHHVWLSMRAELAPGRVEMVLDVVPTAPAEAAHSEVEIDFVPVAGMPEIVEFVGWPARVLDPACAVGKPVKLVVALRDAAGTSAHGELAVVPDPPKAGFPEPCEK
jgi:hypothetical protein